MSNSKNIAVNINGYDVHPTGRYDLSFVLKVLNCSRPNISYLIKNRKRHNTSENSIVKQNNIA